MSKTDQGEYGQLNLGSLIIDPLYQRVLNQEWIEAQLKEGFDWRMFDTLQVSARAHGQYAVLDGQHRLVMARSIGAATVPCIVHHGLSLEEEADLFVGGNKKRRPLLKEQEFKARLVAKDSAALDIKRAIEAAGYTLNLSRHGGVRGGVRAVGALQGIYDQSGFVGVRDTLETVNEAWDSEPNATDGPMLRAVHAVLRLNVPEDFSRERLIRGLQREMPSVIMRRGRAKGMEMGEPGGRGPLIGIYRVIVDLATPRGKTPRYRPLAGLRSNRGPRQGGDE